MKASRVRAVMATLVIGLLFGICQSVFSADEQVHKDEMGLLRLKIVNPESNAAIDDTKPVIGADASQLEVPLDPGTVTVAVDGVDVTQSSEITTGYIVYRPPSPLTPGKHEVRITAKDINRKDIEPLTWTFNIKGAEKTGTGNKNGNGTVRLVTSTDYVAAQYTPQPYIDVTQLFREKKGLKQNADLSFTNISEGRTLIGSYHRETQPYSGTVIDKGRLNYSDPNFDATLGSAWFALSDLTVTGAELDGLRIHKKNGPWDLTMFSGRTQDPSTSGGYKQMATGLKSTYGWNEKNSTSVTALSAYENETTGSITVNPLPAKDNMLSFLQEYDPNQNVKATLEYSLDGHKERSKTYTHDDAVQFSLKGSVDSVTGELTAYNYGENFFPIAEGSSKYLENDRKGFLGRGVWQAKSFLRLGGEYETYDTNTDKVNTRRNSDFVAVSHGALQTLQYQKAKLVSFGTDSKTDSVTGVVIIPATGAFTETKLLLGWRDTSYTGAAIQTESKTQLFGINSSYRDVLGFAVSYNKTNTNNVLALATSENTSMSTALNWNIIPFKLMWTGKYEKDENSGTNIGNDEKQISAAFKYVFDKTYTFNLGWENIKYSDSISTVFDYTQNILRSGVEWSF